MMVKKGTIQKIDNNNAKREKKKLVRVKYCNSSELFESILKPTQVHNLLGFDFEFEFFENQVSIDQDRVTFSVRLECVVEDL